MRPFWIHLAIWQKTLMNRKKLYKLHSLIGICSGLFLVVIGFKWFSFSFWTWNRPTITSESMVCCRWNRAAEHRYASRKIKPNSSFPCFGWLVTFGKTKSTGSSLASFFRFGSKKGICDFIKSLYRKNLGKTCREPFWLFLRLGIKSTLYFVYG